MIGLRGNVSKEGCTLRSLWNVGRKVHIDIKSGN